MLKLRLFLISAILLTLLVSGALADGTDESETLLEGGSTSFTITQTAADRVQIAHYPMATDDSPLTLDVSIGGVQQIAYSTSMTHTFGATVYDFDISGWDAMRFREEYEEVVSMSKWGDGDNDGWFIQEVYFAARNQAGEDVDLFELAQQWGNVSNQELVSQGYLWAHYHDWIEVYLLEDALGVSVLVPGNVSCDDTGELATWIQARESGYVVSVDGGEYLVMECPPDNTETLRTHLYPHDMVSGNLLTLKQRLGENGEDLKLVRSNPVTEMTIQSISPDAIITHTAISETPTLTFTFHFTDTSTEGWRPIEEALVLDSRTQWETAPTEEYGWHLQTVWMHGVVSDTINTDYFQIAETWKTMSFTASTAEELYNWAHQNNQYELAFIRETDGVNLRLLNSLTCSQTAELETILSPQVTAWVMDWGGSEIVVTDCPEGWESRILRIHLYDWDPPLPTTELPVYKTFTPLIIKS